MSASVHTVETRTTEAPASWAARRSSLVPIPGSSAVAIRLRSITSAAAAISSWSG